MTLIFAFWGHYDGFQDVLACAKARAGCQIWVISDGAAPAGVNHIPISEFHDANRVRELITPNSGRWASFSLARWFILRDFIALHPSPDLFPVFFADWDVMLFRDLNIAYAPFLKFDYTVSIHDGMESAAYGVNHLHPLNVFCAQVEKWNVDNSPLAKGLNDMEAWSLNNRINNWNVGDLFKITNGSVFDHSMHCGEKEYEFVGPAKDVVFVNGFPHFILKSGELVKAVTLHCWGSYKTRTAEMRQHAGIPL